jgi:hypothetical protein
MDPLRFAPRMTKPDEKRMDSLPSVENDHGCNARLLRLSYRLRSRMTVVAALVS